MSYEEKNITVALFSHLLIGGYYLVNLWQMYYGEGLNAAKVFSLWAIVIVTTILVSIVGNILTNILLAIVQAVKTKTCEEERFIADERDKLIELRGTKHAYIVFSIGVFLAMLTFVFGQPPLVMFSLIILSGIAAEIIGDVARLYFYRRGF
ncbi:MAG: hypothetical protein JW953_14745 [Anaerolineae bacterium]|nr:hypothetical protein [Anaerolineae bacterium]